MKAMILAAGRGERLRPITDRIPKPLLELDGQTLIGRHLRVLRQAGFNQVVINTAWLAERIHQHLGNGHQYGVRILYSDEPSDALDSGGGIYQALPQLGDEPFLVINADILTDMPYSDISLPDNRLAHLVMVNNPDWHPDGDFKLSDGQVTGRQSPRCTFSGVAVYHPDLFVDCKPGKFSVVPLLEDAMRRGQVSGELWAGLWHDTGTAARLQTAREAIALLDEGLPQGRD